MLAHAHGIVRLGFGIKERKRDELEFNMKCGSKSWSVSDFLPFSILNEGVPSQIDPWKSHGLSRRSRFVRSLEGYHQQ
jgi:hypothetical protein